VWVCVPPPAHFVPRSGWTHETSFGKRDFFRFRLSRTRVPSSGKLVALALFGILLVAGILRFYGLGIQSLWVDELASVWFSEPDEAGEVIERTRGDVHPPGYHLVLHFSRALLGESDAAIRFPSAFAGTLSVLAMFFLARRLYSSREGLLAALFTAVFFAPVYYSQEARSYSLLLLFSILTAFFWWGMFSRLRDDERLPPLETFAYVGCAVAASYLHYFGLYLVAFQGAALFLLAPRSLVSVVAVYLPVAAAYLPWLPAMAGQMRDQEPQEARLAAYVSFLFNHSTAMEVVVGGLLAAALIASSGAFILAARRRSLHPIMPGALLVAWAVVPYALAHIVSENLSPILSARNTIIAVPAAYILLARAMMIVLPGRAPRLAVAFAVAALAVSLLVFVDEHYSRPHKQQVREAVEFVTSRADSDPLVVHCGVGREANHYYELQGTDRGDIAHVGACGADRIDAITNAVERGAHESVILVHAHHRPGEKLLEALGDKYELVEHEELVGAGARLYRVDGAG
jgi:mannosyltransferase